MIGSYPYSTTKWKGAAMSAKRGTYLVEFKDLSGHWVETDIPVRFHADLIPELAPSQPLANRKDVK